MNVAKDGVDSPRWLQRLVRRHSSMSRRDLTGVSTQDVMWLEDPRPYLETSADFYGPLIGEGNRW